MRESESHSRIARPSASIAAVIKDVAFLFDLSRQTCTHPNTSFLLVSARNPFQSHQCWQFLGCCEDSEVVNQNNVEGDRDALSSVRALNLGRQEPEGGAIGKNHLSLRDRQCEVLEQVCSKRAFDNFLSG